MAGTIQLLLPDNAVDSDKLAMWAIERLGEDEIKTPADIYPFRAFGVIKHMPDGSVKPLCVVLYNFFRRLKHGNDMRVIIAADSPSWCLPGILRELFKYPFEFAGCERLTAIIRDGNKRSLKLCQGLGFKKEGTLRRGHDGKTNAIVLSMLKHECKWLDRSQTAERENGKQESAFAATGAGSVQTDGRPISRKHRGDARKREDQRDRHIRANGVGHVGT